jgi:uncharacterized protein (DUF924 family)
MDEVEQVLGFWFPPRLDRDEASLFAQSKRWFRGGTDDDIRARYAELTERAARGELDEWAQTVRGRLALILLLDQFPRSLWRDTPRAFAQDPKAQALAREAVDAGLHRQLAPWELLFLSLPFGHSEDLSLQDRSVALAEEMAAQASPPLEKLCEASARQARAHRDVIRRFGRFPHRNAILGRQSTPSELEYLKTETPPHLQGG